MTNVIEEKRTYSITRLRELSQRLETIRELDLLSELTIVGAGSYARHEASEHSDIDPFFIYSGHRSKVDHVRTRELGMFGELIRIIETMRFPPFSNDAQYLDCLSCDEILDNLGSREDDYRNHFTARMLLLLESKPLANPTHYDIVVSKICEAYFRDFPDHQKSFQPQFLLNDIGRFWNTLLVNYENRRNQPHEREDRAKHKVRNFKLRFSRATTCFATIAAIGAHPTTFTPADLTALVSLTPQERLDQAQRHRSDIQGDVSRLRSEYGWFLEQTSMTTEVLEEHFRDRDFARDAFDKARQYGDRLFSILTTLDRDPATGNSRGLIRNLVI